MKKYAAELLNFPINTVVGLVYTRLDLSVPTQDDIDDALFRQEFEQIGVVTGYALNPCNEVVCKVTLLKEGMQVEEAWFHPTRLVRIM